MKFKCLKIKPQKHLKSKQTKRKDFYFLRFEIKQQEQNLHKKTPPGFLVEGSIVGLFYVAFKIILSN